jgi:single stranded DNA-binding protein
LEIVVVPNRSLQTTSAQTGVGKQSYFSKEAKQAGPASASFRRGPDTQPMPVRQLQAPPTSTASYANRQRGNPSAQNKPNKVSVTGRLGRDAVVRYTKNSHTVANFSVAVDESYKDLLGQLQKKTAWHRVQVWDELAETVSPGLMKGTRVYVEGRLIHRQWIDRENKPRTSTEVVASDVRFLDTAPKPETRDLGELSAELF